MQVETLETLVVRARDTDEGAFEELVRRCSKLLYVKIYSEVQDVERAEDLVQEAWIKAYRTLDSLKDPKGFVSWILQIGRNCTMDWFRREGRLKRGGNEKPVSLVHEVEGTSARPEEELIQREEGSRALETLRSLPERYQMPLMLRYIGGMDYQAITDTLGISSGALRGLLHRGTRLMRERLAAVEH